MFNVIDLFCGTGAISYGLKSFDSRFNVVGGIDQDEAACKTAAANHPSGKFICSSIEKLSPRKFCDLVGVTKVDMIVGGPPCQGFSSLRPNRQSNIDDPRNRLYKNFFEYVRGLEPSVFLMENVIGLVNNSRGALLSEIVSRYRKIGYEVDWRILNAANYGVPQKRERVLIIGARRARIRKPRIAFPEPTHFFEGRVIGTREKEKYVVNINKGVPALTVRTAISDLPGLASGQTKEHYGSAPKNEYQLARRRGASARVTLHEACNHSPKMLEVMRHAGGSKSVLPKGLVSSGFSSCYSRMAPNEPATTITVKFTSPASSKCIHPTQNRSITPREAARLQGFDDAFVFCGSKTEIASQIGNAVPPLFGKALAPIFIENLEAVQIAR
jgi:DNA (cytosine-5)-methyltransferase 1